VLVTDRHATGGRDMIAVVRDALAAGLPAVQLRDKDLSGRALLALAEALRRATADTGALLLVNERVDVAIAAGADGVHLGGGAVPVAVARALLPPAALVGVSTHAPGAPDAEGADFLFFGPVWTTPAKAAFGPPQGAAALARAVAAASVPVLAIGGVDAARVSAARAAGAAGVAVVRAVLGAPDPGRAVRALLAALAAELPLPPTGPPR
jgi:thiamine-phosphate pyrophosphorylase